MNSLIILLALSISSQAKDRQEYVQDIINASSKPSHTRKQEAQEIIALSKKAEEEKKEETLKHLSFLHKGQSCSSCQAKGFLEKSLSGPQKEGTGKLLIFVSSSLPAASLKSLHEQARAKKATLIFHGLIDNSFAKTKTFFDEQQISGDINPILFEDYQITHVPTFILREGSTFDRIQGNITLDEALTQIKEKGELKEKAKQILSQGTRA